MKSLATWQKFRQNLAKHSVDARFKGKSLRDGR